jgi:hypothetical protein
MGNFIKCIFKSSLFYIILTTLICLSFNAGINVGIAYLYLFLIDKFLADYFYLKYILIPILLLYNYLLLRRIVIHWIFEWQFPFQIFSIYKERQNYIGYLKSRIVGFINSIDVLLNVEYKLTENEVYEIIYFLDLFEEEFYIYDNLYNIVYTDNGIHNNNLIRYKMSNKQVDYYNILKHINILLNENDLRDKLRNINLQNNHFENSIKRDNNQENITSLTQLKILINNELLPIIEKYNWENYTYMSPAYIFNLLFNDTFGSLSLYSLQFKKNFQDYLLEENYTSNGKIHYTLIRKVKKGNNVSENSNELNEINTEENLLMKEEEQNDDGTLLFFSLPNGGCYELIPKSKIEFYLTNGFSFLCWNYRGYGYSKGSSNFSNCKEDALDVFDTVTKNKKYNFKKICVMGHSIGGIAMSHIAKNRDVDMLISDRNFCDIPKIVLNLHCGTVLNFLLKFLLIGKTNIIDNIMEQNIEQGLKNKNINNINKIIIYSPSDNLILNDATVKSGIARYFIKNYIFYKNNNNLIIKSKENFLDLVFNSNDKNIFLDTLIDLIHMNHDMALDYKNELNNNKIEIIQSEHIVNEKDDISFLFFDKFFGICCDNLSFISENLFSVRRQKLFLDNFFNNLLIWGAQGEEIYSNEETFEFYSYKGLKLIQEASDILDKSNYTENSNNSNNNSFTRKLFLIDTLKIYFKQILNAMKNLDIDTNLNNINNKRNSLRISNLTNSNIKEKLIMTEDEEDEINTNNTNNNIIDTKIELNSELINIENNNNIIRINFYQKLNDIIGNFKLFKTCVGHNGSLRMDEQEQFFCLLLKSGIIK